MKRALAIFRKDARRLWPLGAALCGLLAVAAATDPAYTSFRWREYMDFALPIACWILVAAAIQQEYLPGDRQYWLTRPVGRRDLVLAKMLFAGAFVMLPVAVYHLAVWIALGINPLEHGGLLLWKEAVLFAVWLLPVAAMAAVTRNAGETILAAVAGCAIVIAGIAVWSWRWRGQPSNMPDVSQGILIVGTAAAVLFQYWTRRAGWGRLMLAATAAAMVLIPMESRGGARLRMRPDGAAQRILPDTSRPVRLETGFRVEIPIRVEGLDEGGDVFGERIELKLNGREFSAPWAMSRDTLKIWSYGDVLRVFERGADVEGTVWMVAFRRRGAVAAPRAGWARMAGAGVCGPRPNRGKVELACYTPSSRVAMYAEGGKGDPINWIVPYGIAAAGLEAISVFRPVERHSSQLTYRSAEDLKAVTVVTADPGGRLVRSFRFEKVRIAGGR
jgi:hypothetical protein